MNKLTIINKNGQLLVDSREVAEMVQKEHKNLIRDIKGYIDILNNSHSSNLSSENFFKPYVYMNSRNQEQPCYLLTRKGCDMVANKMTGEKGVLFTAEYVTTFENMENKIKEVKQLSPMDQLKLQYQVLGEHEEKLSEVSEKIIYLEGAMTIDHGQAVNIKLAVDLNVRRLCCGNESRAYTNKKIRSKVYRFIWKSIKEYFNVTAYHNLLRKDTTEALNYINHLALQGGILREVQQENSQMSLGV